MSKEIYLKALLADKNGDWNTAHEFIQDLEAREAAWIHAYLHRKEGDRFNAGYWYNRANKPVFEGSLEEEWQMLWTAFKG